MGVYSGFISQLLSKLQNDPMKNYWADIRQRMSSPGWQEFIQTGTNESVRPGDNSYLRWGGRDAAAINQDNERNMREAMATLSAYWGGPPPSSNVTVKNPILHRIIFGNSPSVQNRSWHGDAQDRRFEAEAENIESILSSRAAASSGDSSSGGSPGGSSGGGGGASTANRPNDPNAPGPKKQDDPYYSLMRLALLGKR